MKDTEETERSAQVWLNYQILIILEPCLIFLIVCLILYILNISFAAYYDWSPWTTCEKKCGVEFYNRTRECVDPEASFCIADETIQKRSCDLKPCAGEL
jgi:hypothetical protein